MQSAINLEQAVLENLRQLPLDKQQEVLDFAEFLRRKTPPNRPRKSLRGLCADLNIQLSEEEITAARQEMWVNFPREILE
jgi:Protein of unknown function (DUF2281)